SNAILKEYTKNLESLVEVTRELGSSLEEGTIYRIMAETSKKILNVEVSCFFRYSNTHKRLILSSLEGIELKPLQDLDLKMAEKGVYSFLLDLKAPKLVPDLSEEKAFSMPTEFLEAGLKTAAFVPIFSKDKIFGVLAVFLKEPRKFKKEEIEILQSIGSSAAIAVENAILYNEIKKFASNLEKKVRERTAELEHSNKLKDLFIDIMGHDLLKPADIARLSAELALDREEDPDKIKTLQTILQSNERIIDMIENASILAKLESKEKLEFKEDDLGFILKSVAKEITDLADEKKVKIKITAEGEFSALINPLIYDVFSNLISNAIKYGPEDSEVVAGIENVGKNWKISVVDNGPGIPDEHKKAIFDRFKRIKKDAVKGTGLGLAIVKRVVKAHKGRVWVEDNPGGGSMFIVEIPKA
ncbi:MAG: ATP-binding protein, partial [Candidatus Hydrothermarchaeales archaeon]